MKSKINKIIRSAAIATVGVLSLCSCNDFLTITPSDKTVLKDYWKTKDDDREKQARALFGHLCLYNRLNVSMSRQKKLLVVVGDMGLLQSELAADFVPGLVDFLKLCYEQGVVMSC